MQQAKATMTKPSFCYPRSSLVTLCLLLATSCSLKSFDSLQEGSAGGDSATGGQSDGGATFGETGGAGEGGTNAVGGASGGAGGGTTAMGGTSSVATTVAPPPFGPWEFADQASSPPSQTLWAINPLKTDKMSASWIALGETDSGSMRLDATGQSEVLFGTPNAIPTDLSAYTIFFRVRTEAGSAPCKPYVFDNGTWADAGDKMVGTEWMTISLNFADPGAYVPAEYTGTGATGFGFQVSVTSPVTIYVDRIWLERAP